MRNIISLILIFVLIAGIVGCEEPVKKTPKVPKSAIKISDLMPVNSEKLPPAINFKIYTFQIPVNKYGAMSGVLNTLNKDSIRFSNYKSFTANGFDAGLGNALTWKMVGDGLKRAGAKRAKVSTLIVYDHLGDDFFIGGLPSETLAYYYALDRSDVETILAPGSLCWNIRARKVADRRGLAQVRIQGLYKQHLNPKLSRLPDYDNGEILFKPSSVIMNMNEGDFILLGAQPKTVSLEPLEKEDKRFVNSPITGGRVERIRLVDLFFRTQADMIVPKKIDGKVQKTKTGDILYEQARDVSVAEMFLIVCVGVND